MGQFIDLTAADGFSLQAWRAEPSGVPRGGLVVVQENAKSGASQKGKAAPMPRSRARS